MGGAGLGVLGALVAMASVQVTNDPPEVWLKLPDTPVAPKSLFKGTLTVHFADGLHVYQNPPSQPGLFPISVQVKRGDLKVIGAVYPPGDDWAPNGVRKPIKIYSGVIRVPITFRSGTHSGPVVVLLRYQQCTDFRSFAPDAVAARAVLRIDRKSKG